MRQRTISVILAVSLTLAGVTLLTINNASAQHDHSQHQAKPVQKHDQHGGMMHSKDHMQQMMSEMAKKPEMLKMHVGMVMSNRELRPALVKLLKEDKELRLELEKLLAEARE